MVSDLLSFFIFLAVINCVVLLMIFITNIRINEAGHLLNEVVIIVFIEDDKNHKQTLQRFHQV